MRELSRLAVLGAGVTYTFGLDTFGDRNSDADGKPLSHAQTIRNVTALLPGPQWAQRTEAATSYAT